MIRILISYVEAMDIYLNLHLTLVLSNFFFGVKKVTRLIWIHVEAMDISHLH